LWEAGLECGDVRRVKGEGGGSCIGMVSNSR
jgi:hypothetical protein